MSDSPTAVRVHVEGLVQGVGFRYYTVRAAKQAGVCGFVRNLPDGRVEAYAEGSKEEIQQFLRLVARGPSFSRVDNIEEVWAEPTGKYSSFSIA